MHERKKAREREDEKGEEVNEGNDIVEGVTFVCVSLITF